MTPNQETPANTNGTKGFKRMVQLFAQELDRTLMALQALDSK